MPPLASRSACPGRLTRLALCAAVCGLAAAALPAPAWAQGRKKAAASSTLPKLATEVAFKNLRFDRPVVMAYPKDDKGLLFVVEQHQAKIWSFPNDRNTDDRQLFLELPDPINRGNEEGLLGLAFHPRYKENGEFFVYYSATSPNPRQSVVSRFRVSKDNPRVADPASEQRIWVSANDPFENHNGGCIEFGPDGFLYISLGDSGAADDPLVTGQNPKDWFASILRIDVDHPSDGKPYGIPPDNPRLRDPRFAAWAPEVYCIGLRNVWKFSFDRETGALWAGDVGQNLWEMVYILQNGGNYGWSLKEGTHNFRPRQRADRASKITPPVVEYSHSAGKSITGGYVYRGKAIPDLVGVYIYGDYDSGRIWGLREKDGKATEHAELIDLRHNPKLNIMAFGEDPQGEVYILAQDGRIHGFVPRP